jgi:hypothetical protein
MSSRSSSSRTEQASRQATEQKAPVTKQAEPNTAGTKPGAVAARPAGTSDAGAHPAEAGPPPDAPQVGDLGLGVKYDIILTRNMFSRQRIPFRPRDKNVETQVVASNPETHFVLKGIAQENNQFIAFVEDTQGGGVQRLRSGDHVARGTVKTLSLDALEYQLEDKTISVKMGCDLEGTRVAAAAPVVSTPSASQTPTAAPAGQQATSPQQTPAASGDEAEILKRLMEQRKQQGGQ